MSLWVQFGITCIFEMSPKWPRKLSWGWLWKQGELNSKQAGGGISEPHPWCPDSWLHWAASACSLQLRALLYALSVATAGCEPQQEPLKFLSRWGCEQWFLGWAGLWGSASSDLSRQGESVCWRQGGNTPSWTPRCLWQLAAIAPWLLPFWAAFERAAVIAGAWHV